MSLPEYVYVASSWRNLMQEAVVETLRAANISHYDFKNPEGGTGFHWSEVMPNYVKGSELAEVNEYLECLSHPRSEQGFLSDFDAMNRADTFILVLPCGRSAHLEMGWAVGAGKRTAILLYPEERIQPNSEGARADFVVPELMYKMVDLITPSMMELLGWLGVED